MSRSVSDLENKSGTECSASAAGNDHCYSFESDVISVFSLHPFVLFFTSVLLSESCFIHPMNNLTGTVPSFLYKFSFSPGGSFAIRQEVSRSGSESQMSAGGHFLIM